MYACDSAMFDYDTLKGLPGFCTAKNIQEIYLKKFTPKEKRLSWKEWSYTREKYDVLFFKDMNDS